LRLRRRLEQRRRSCWRVEDAGAAQRAGGVPLEPKADALRVERVRARREEAQGVVVVELEEADGALEHVVFAPVHDPVLPHLAEEHQRQRGDRGGVEPSLTAAPAAAGPLRCRRRVRSLRVVVGGPEQAEAGEGEKHDEDGEEYGHEHRDAHHVGDHWVVARLYARMAVQIFLPYAVRSCRVNQDKNGWQISHFEKKQILLLFFELQTIVLQFTLNQHITFEC